MAVEDVVAEFLHFQDGFVGPPFGCRVDDSAHHLADDDVVIAALDECGNRAERRIQGTRSGASESATRSANSASASAERQSIHQWTGL